VLEGQVVLAGQLLEVVWPAVVLAVDIRVVALLLQALQEELILPALLLEEIAVIEMADLVAAVLLGITLVVVVVATLAAAAAAYHLVLVVT
jgi:hypothetical protein